MRNCPLIVALCCCIAPGFTSNVWSGDLTASQLMPETTVGYLEVTDAAAIMGMLYDHPLSHHIQSLDAWKQATNTEHSLRGMFQRGRTKIRRQPT